VAGPSQAKPGHDDFNLIEKRTWPQRNCENEPNPINMTTNPAQHRHARACPWDKPAHPPLYRCQAWARAKLGHDEFNLSRNEPGRNETAKTNRTQSIWPNEPSPAPSCAGRNVEESRRRAGVPRIHAFTAGLGVHWSALFERATKPN